MIHVHVPYAYYDSQAHEPLIIITMITIIVQLLCPTYYSITCITQQRPIYSHHYGSRTYPCRDTTALPLTKASSESFLRSYRHELD